jgi:hypothetical protein
MFARLFVIAALLALFSAAMPAQASIIATEDHAQRVEQLYFQARGSSGSNSHYVHPYCRKNGTCVRGHMAGNAHSGNHWHLNKDGSDTVTHANGSRETVPNVAPPK